MARFENKQNISNITLFKKLHNFCILGKDWYTNNLTIIMEPGEIIPDYVEIEAEINKLESQELIIEDVVNLVFEIVNSYNPKRIKVISEVDDATHLKVKVEKEFNVTI